MNQTSNFQAIKCHIIHDIFAYSIIIDQIRNLNGFYSVLTDKNDFISLKTVQTRLITMRSKPDYVEFVLL